MKILRNATVGALLLLAALAAPAAAQDGVQTLSYEYGPITITPGQNTIAIEENALKPPVGRLDHPLQARPGAGGRHGAARRRHPPAPRRLAVPSGFKPLFAAGEEKTEFTAPPGFGWRYKTSDRWLMNHMIHNLTPTEEEVYITYELDFIPATSPAAAGDPRDRDGVAGHGRRRSIRCSTPSAAATAATRRFTYPDEDAAAPRPTAGGVPEDGALVGAGGHLHPGGLYTDLKLTRDGRTVPLFRSEAKYFEPAGAVSWDVAMTVTPAVVARRRARGRRHQRLGHLRHAQGVVVRVDGDHARDVRARRERARPVHHRRERPRRGHPRPPGRERQPRRRPLLRPARRARPLRPPRARRRRRGRGLRLRLRPGRSEHARQARPARARQARQAPHVRQPRRAAEGEHHAHDHRVQGALQPRRRASPTRWRTGRSTSTRATSASARPA